MCHVCMYATRICINACTDKCNRANESDNLFFVHLSGARNVGYNDQHEGGNGIHTSREHSPKLPRCHSGRTSRFEREASRELGQHATWLTDTAGTAARGSRNRAFFSCHQWAANAPGCSQRRCTSFLSPLLRSARGRGKLKHSATPNDEDSHNKTKTAVTPQQ